MTCVRMKDHIFHSIHVKHQRETDRTLVYKKVSVQRKITTYNKSSALNLRYTRVTMISQWWGSSCFSVKVEINKEMDICTQGSLLKLRLGYGIVHQIENGKDVKKTTINMEQKLLSTFYFDDNRNIVYILRGYTSIS